MPNDFLPESGCVKAIKFKPSSAMYEIDNFELDKINTEYASGLVTIDNVRVGSSDAYAKIVALDNYKALYRFGSNFSSLEIHGKIYIGPNGAAANDTLGFVEDFYQNNRLSVKDEPLRVSIANDAAYFAYLVDLTYSQPDLNFGIIHYTITGIVLDNPNPGK